MDQNAKKIQSQRLRNRMIEALEICSSLEDISQLGSHETLEIAKDYLPHEDSYTDKIFSTEEQAALAIFASALRGAESATHQVTWDRVWFEKQEEWLTLIAASANARSIFERRGRFDEEQIDPKAK